MKMSVALFHESFILSSPWKHAKEYEDSKKCEIGHRNAFNYDYFQLLKLISSYEVLHRIY